ncbi:MAG: FAD-dependent monooxygenase [Pseudoclavibacter sp.]
MSLRVACIGGGPGGLFFATQLKRQSPDTEVVLFERNQPEDAFGFGVVFSDSTLKRINEADPVLRDGLSEHGRHWERIEVWNRGAKIGFDGNGMAAIHRRRLLPLLQSGAAEAGVELRFGVNVSSLEDLADFDVIVGADGANSFVRRAIEGDIGQTVETATAKFIWFGTDHMFDGLTFVHRTSEFGAFAAHAYPISDDISTFIVETDEETWRAAGLDEFDVTQPPGASDEKTREFVERLFAEDLAGGTVIANNSRWANFRTRRTDTWHSGNVVLLGDAVHTAHFSVGSGTKMAMEDGIALARELAAGHASLEDAFVAYEADRQPPVKKIQDAARGGLSWWEHFGFYGRTLEPAQLAFHFFSRSINIDRIEPRDPKLVAEVRADWEAKHGSPALSTPFTVGDTRFDGRVLEVEGDHLTSAEARVSVTGDVSVISVPREPLDEQQIEQLAAAAEHGTVLVTGGDPLQRVRVSEQARLAFGRTSLIEVEPGGPLDPETLVLSGRADAVVTNAGDARV